MNRKKITIAIDGFSSCGKSTLAKQLAKELQYIFIDSGAMYRAVTLYALQNGGISGGKVDQNTILPLLDQISLEFKLNQTTQFPEIYLNGNNVDNEIRSPEVSSLVSQVASIKEVRTKLVEEQRRIGANGGIVMDGRDIGSVVFPNAELKIFVTANIDTRTDRRFSELKEKGIDISRDEVQANLIERDHLDSTRAISPLTQTEDAIVIDNTSLSREQQLAHAIDLVDQAIPA